jgi:hypothetical protein
MNLLQNKRKREEVKSELSKFFPDFNSKFSLRFKNNSNSLNNLGNIFFFQKNNFSNKNNYIQEKAIDNNFGQNLFNINFFKNERIKYFLMPSVFQIERYMNLEEFKNNNFVQVPHIFEDDKNNINDKTKVKLEQNLKKNDENKNIIFTKEKNNTFENILNNINNINNINNKKQTHFSIKKEVKIIKPPQMISNTNINSNSNINPNQNGIGIFTTKNISEISQKKSDVQNNSTNNIIETTRPFQTFNAKYFTKSNQNTDKNKSNQAKIFHIEKIFNKDEYRDANEKDTNSEDKNLKNRFKISLKKIKQIFMNSCLKIYLFHNDKMNFTENKLKDQVFMTQMTQQVYDIIKSKKINSSRMNEILQVNDDDKYRKHYFMFTSEAKQFCLDLINIKKLSFDIVMKMCKVPRKSLRRWSHVGCNRKKGCGRKTRNPEMENKLIEWYREEINGGANVSAKMIRDKAVEISGDKDFLASKGWLEKFKKKFGIRIATHKNKNFKKIISFKDKIKLSDDNFLEEKEINKDCDKKINLGINKNNNNEKNSDIISDNNEEDNDNEINDNEEDKNENINELNENEENYDNGENDMDDNLNNENEININIINNSEENEKNDDIKNKINENINLRRPIFYKTKIDKVNNKKFNVFKLNTVC